MSVAAMFLTCAMSLPVVSHTRPAITPWNMARSVEDKIKDFIHRSEPGAEVFITPRGDAERLRGYGYERVPFTYNDKEIWIQRKPRSDQKRIREAA